MNFNTVNEIRQQVYQRCEQSRDALFELIDALSSESGSAENSSLEVKCGTDKEA